MLVLTNFSYFSIFVIISKKTRQMKEASTLFFNITQQPCFDVFFLNSIQFLTNS